MQSHLNTGCRECTQAAGLWQRVHQVARQERSYEPPEAAVRTIKGTFAIRGPRKPTHGMRAIAKLLFDSSRNPLPAGVRSTATTIRQLLYGTGDYRIDVRIEPRLDSDKVTIVGQVLNSADPSEGVGSVAVALIKGRKVLAQSLTNRFGEFNLECELEQRFLLRVELPGGEVRLPLIEPDQVGPESTESQRLNRLLRRGKDSTRKKV